MLLNLEDKVILLGGGNDEKTPCIPQKFSCVDEKKTPCRFGSGVKPNAKYLNMVVCDQLLTIWSTELSNNKDLEEF